MAAYERAETSVRIKIVAVNGRKPPAPPTASLLRWPSCRYPKRMGMQAESPPKAAGKRANNRALRPRKPTARSRVSNGADYFLPGVDQRSALARRFRDIASAIVSDQGGIDRCSESRLQLIRRFAACAVQAEQMEANLASGAVIEVAAHAQLSSTLVRLASRLGIDRRTRAVVPALRDYIDGKTEAAE